MSNGSVISIPGLVEEEEEIFVPPPPSTAPPPPPSFIPPPDFMGDLNSLDLANLQPPSMPAPKLAPSMAEEDFTILKPPPMAPPKPPSTCSSGSASSIPISSPPVPDYPKFAPPQPPPEKQQKTYKTPPPKPIRLSSIAALDSPPQSPAPPPPMQTPTQSTFNPQNTAKLYSSPKTAILGGHEDQDARPKQMLLLEDSGSSQCAPVVVQVDGKAPSEVAATSKPVSKDIQEPKENLPITQHSPSPLPEPNKEAEAETVSAPPEEDKPLPTIRKTSPLLKKVNIPSEPNKDKFEVTPSQGHRFSPILDRKLRNLKGMETNGPREGPVASPLALLMAAKERDKQRTTLSLSRENSSKNTERPSASIQPSDSSPNSFIVTPRSSSSSSVTSQDMIQDSPKPASLVEHTQTLQTSQKSSSPALVKDQMQLNSPALNSMAASPRVPNLVAQKQNAEQGLSTLQSTKDVNNKEESNMLLLPPPPEFDDLDAIMEPPPSIRPPDPPMKRAPTPTMIPPPPTHVPSPPPMKAPPMPSVIPSPPTYVPSPPPMKKSPTPSMIPQPPTHVPSPPPMKRAPTPTMIPPPPAHVPSPPPMKKAPTPTVIPPPPPPPQVPSPPSKPKPQGPPAPPKLPPPAIDVKPKPQDQTKLKMAPSQLPTNLSPSQATLLSILQKKMLEMDHKMAPMKDAESSSDDWGTPLSDEDSKVPVVPRATPQSRNIPPVNKAATLNLRELEGKVSKRYQDTSSNKVSTR